MATLGFDTSTTDIVAGQDLSAMTAVVTGASAGLGIETSRALASAGAKVIMLGRDAKKLAAAAEGLQAEDLAGTIETGIVDLADFDSIRACAADLIARLPAITTLINNAGVMAPPLQRTAQGLEMQFGTNHVGHFLLTCLLVPALLAGAHARIVNLSSAGHRFANIDFDDPNYQQRDYDKWQAYGQSKTCNALFTVALEARLAERGIHAYAVHPGVIMTELSRYMEQSDFDLLMSNQPEGQEMRFKTIPQGAATSVWAATAAELDGQGGLYLEDCHIGEVAQPGQETQLEGGVEAYALDAQAAEKLWSLSEQLVGERFDL